ncbi:MAG: hypothetical protein IJF87_04535 [Erysipelotrichaceae bacterium]|nr:hypothetical protein [Erysipelotrichaceae bacterium]
MKKKLIIILLILLTGGTLVFGAMKPKGLSKKTTIEQLKKIKSEHGELLCVSFHRGGGMNGDNFSQTIERNKEGQIVLTVKESPEHWIPLRVWEYLIEDEDVFAKLRAYSDEYNLPAWKDLPFDEENIALDAPSSSIGLIFNDEEYGGWRREYYTISYENVIPEGGYDVLNGFVSLIGSYAKKENLIRTYLECDDNQILTGRDIENSEEEIEKLIMGYWGSEELGDDGYSRYSLYTSPYEEGMELYQRGGDKIIFQREQTIHESLADYDSSWYFILKDTGDPEKLYYLTVAGDKLYLEKQTEPDKEIILFERH